MNDWQFIDYTMTPRTEYVSRTYGHRPRTAMLRQKIKHGLAYFVTAEHDLTPEPSEHHIGLIIHTGRKRKYQGKPLFIRKEDARVILALAISQL